MTIRPTQSSIFNLVRMGLLDGTRGTIRAQEQLSSGRRLLRPSDDPVDYAEAASFQRDLAREQRFGAAATDARQLLDAAAASVQDVSEQITRVRELVIQAMNGTLTDADRNSIAVEIQQIRRQVIDAGNSKLGEQYLFAGTSDVPPFQAANGQQNAIRYAGNDDSVNLAVGADTTAKATTPGDEIFARREPGSTSFGNLTGAAAGASTDQGSGYAYLEVRHDATTGTLGSGLALVNGPDDTIIGSHTLSIDTATGLVQLDNGRSVPLPSPTDPAASDFRLVNEHGAVLHVDFTGFDGTSSTSTVVGDGSVSIDGSTYVPIDFVDADLRLTDASSSTVLHVDVRNIHRAGNELVEFGGTVNLFDNLQGIVEDLLNADGLSTAQVQDRLQGRLTELDRNHTNVLRGLGVLGARSARMTGLQDRLQDSTLELEGLISERRDADVSQVVLDMAQAQQALEATQASGARLLQTSLLNFLR